MKLKDNYYLMESSTNQQLYKADPVLYGRIMSGWAALPSTIRGQICAALNFHYPLRAWGNENGFDFWTMSQLGARLAFHVGEPPPLRHMLLVIKVGDESDNCRCHWNRKRPNMGNYNSLREKVIRTAFEKMATSGPKNREWIHDLIGEIYPLSSV